MAYSALWHVWIMGAEVGIILTAAVAAMEPRDDRYYVLLAGFIAAVLWPVLLVVAIMAAAEAWEAKG